MFAMTFGSRSVPSPHSPFKKYESEFDGCPELLSPINGGTGAIGASDMKLSKNRRAQE
jgi:hypothetical protein